VFYKDSNGVVSGPISVEEARAMLKTDLKENHTFKVMDSDDFQSFDDLRTLNGAENPFEKTEPSSEKEEQKELELSTVLKKQNEVLPIHENLEELRKYTINQFKEAMRTRNRFVFARGACWHQDEAKFNRIDNESNVTIRVQYGNSCDPSKWVLSKPSDTAFFPGKAGGQYVFVAPFLSSDPMDGSDLVHM
ncbi:hypothetical protein PENTCL1PPCAC_12945, partial [Pristionchus entomophagus]